MLFKKLFLSLILALTIINPVAAYAISLIPGGDSIGIELDYQGVVITGGYAIEIDNKSYNPISNDFQVGDLITAIDDQKVTCIEDLTYVIKNKTDDLTYDLTI